MSIPEHVKSHPIFGGGRYGIMSGENPMFNSGIEQPSHEKLVRALKDMHLKFQETHGRYGAPERSVIVHNPSREHMSQLGKMFGQESVVFGQGGRHELLYTNGEHEGKSRLTDPTQHPINYFADPPEDYYSALPGSGGYFRINFDWGSDPTYQGPVEASKLNKGWPKDEAENQANMQAHQAIAERAAVQSDRLEEEGLPNTGLHPNALANIRNRAKIGNDPGTIGRISQARHANDIARFNEEDPFEPASPVMPARATIEAGGYDNAPFVREQQHLGDWHDRLDHKYWQGVGRAAGIQKNLTKGWPKDEAENQANMQAHQVAQDAIMERSKPVHDPDGKAGMGWLPEIEDSLRPRSAGYKRIRDVVNNSYRNASNFGNINEPSVRGATYNRVDPSNPEKGQVQPVFSTRHDSHENIARENDRSFWKEVDRYSAPVQEPRRVRDVQIDRGPISRGDVSRSDDHIYDYSHLLGPQSNQKLFVLHNPIYNQGVSPIGVRVDESGQHLEPFAIGSSGGEPYSSQGWRGPEVSPELRNALALHSAWINNQNREQAIADNAAAFAAQGKPFYIPGPNSSAAQIPSKQEMAEALQRSPIMKRKKKLGKAALDPGKTGRHNVVLPVGSQIDSGPTGTRNVGKVKVEDKETGKTKWRSVRAGLVMDPQGNPVSSRNPSGNLGKMAKAWPKNEAENQANIQANEQFQQRAAVAEDQAQEQGKSTVMSGKSIFERLKAKKEALVPSSGTNAALAFQAINQIAEARRAELASSSRGSLRHSLGPEPTGMPSRYSVDYVTAGGYDLAPFGQAVPQSINADRRFWQHTDDMSGTQTPGPVDQSDLKISKHPHAYNWHDGHTDHHTGLAKNANEQHASVGTAPDYHRFAGPYGQVTGKPNSLKFYRYENKLPEIDKMVKDHGYQHYYAGGKYGNKPDLAKKNYNTGHLMIYDPSPASGGDFGDHQYTDGWRKIHELSHALVYPELNSIYGEGRRIGKLITHRTPTEAMRAVHWEWLAAHKQRELSKQIGVHLSDEDFHRELNTVMHDAVHRAVTGKFTDPGEEGFVPHGHAIPLAHALDTIRDEAARLSQPKITKSLKDLRKSALETKKSESKK
jgi:hypothetical protein